MTKLELKIQEKYKTSVEEFVRRALVKYGDKIDEIILFGSVARREAREDSDIDILVIGEVSLDELVNISFPILLEYEKLISAKNMNKEHFDFLVREGYSFASTISKEGIILYEGMGKAFGESRREAQLSESFI